MAESSDSGKTPVGREEGMVGSWRFDDVQEEAVDEEKEDGGDCSGDDYDGDDYDNDDDDDSSGLNTGYKSSEPLKTRFYVMLRYVMIPIRFLQAVVRLSDNLAHVRQETQFVGSRFY